MSELIKISYQRPFDGEACWGYNQKFDEYYKVHYDEYYDCFFDVEDFKPLEITHWSSRELKEVQ